MKFNFLRFLTGLILILLTSQCDQPKRRFNEWGVMGDHAMVVSAHPLASQVGADIMKKGGNAVDAAIAVQFALAVVHPAAGNIGGGGFMVYRETNGNSYSLDFREKAPAAATRNMYLNEDGEVIEDLSLLGHLASGVPGSVDGMVAAHERFGSLPWAELIRPAIALATVGFTLTEREAEGLNQNRDNFLQANTVPSEFMSKLSWSPGDSIKYPQLAETLLRIAEHGRDGFYSGETARLIVEEMERGGGLITLEDLENYESVWREPIINDYKAFRIISMGPPSSGGIALSQLLQMLESFDLKNMGWHSAPYIHLLSEAEKRVYADRASHLGDKDFYPVPVEQLLDRQYNLERAKGIDKEKSTPSSEVFAGAFNGYESEETTHFSIVDPMGNAVALTTTLNGSYGSKVVVAGAGFLLNNEMDDFSIRPGVPNMFGLIGGEANAIEPEKRMLSSMTPTIVEKEGELYMVTGSPGGAKIITAVLQSILNVVEFGMTMQSAVDAPRFHHQWLPDRITVEQGCLDQDRRLMLESMGHTIHEIDAMGRVDAILVWPDGRLEGGADPRGDDGAVGL